MESHPFVRSDTQPPLPGSVPSILGKRKTPPPPPFLCPSNPVYTPPVPINGEVATTGSTGVNAADGVVAGAGGNQQTGGEDQSVSVEMGVDVGVDVDSNTELAGEQAKSQLPSGERRKRVDIERRPVLSKDEIEQVNRKVLGHIGKVQEESFFCTLCSARLNCKMHLEKHCIANEHLRRIVSLKKDKSLAHQYCNICHVSCNTDMIYEDHMAGKKHAKNLENFEFGKRQNVHILGDRLDQLLYREVEAEGDGLSLGLSQTMQQFFTMEGPFIGLQYALEIGTAQNPNPTYHCTLCNVLTEANNYQLHFTSSAHRMNVLRKDYPEKHKEALDAMNAVSTKGNFNPALRVIAAAIEAKEGRKIELIKRRILRSCDQSEHPSGRGRRGAKRGSNYAASTNRGGSNHGFWEDSYEQESQGFWRGNSRGARGRPRSRGGPGPRGRGGYTQRGGSSQYNQGYENDDGDYYEYQPEQQWGGNKRSRGRARARARGGRNLTHYNQGNWEEGYEELPPNVPRGNIQQRGTRARARARGGRNLTHYNPGNWEEGYEELPPNVPRGNIQQRGTRGRARARGGRNLTHYNPGNWEESYEELPNFSGGNAERRGARGRASVRGGSRSDRGGRGNRRERNSFSGGANSELFDDSVLYEPPEKKFNSSEYKYGPPFVGGASRSPPQQFGGTIGHPPPPSSNFATGSQFFVAPPQTTMQWGGPSPTTPQPGFPGFPGSAPTTPQPGLPGFPGSGHNMFVSSPSHMESVARSQPMHVQSPSVTDTATAINKLANSKIETEEDAAKAFQISTALTQALLAYRLNSAVKDTGNASAIVTLLGSLQGTDSFSGDSDSTTQK